MSMKGFCILTRWPQVAPGEFQVGYWEAFILRKSSEVSEQAAQGSGRFTVPRGVQETWRSDTVRHGGERIMVGLDYFSGLFQP